MCSHLHSISGVYIINLTGIWRAASYLESSQKTNSEFGSMYVMCSHLHSVSGIDAIISKKKVVNLVVLYSNSKGTYTRANTNVVDIANVMKKADNFIFARSIRW